MVDCGLYSVISGSCSITRLFWAEAILEPAMNQLGQKTNQIPASRLQMGSVVAVRSGSSKLLITGLVLISLFLIVQCSSNEPAPTAVVATATFTPAPVPTATPGPTATPFATPTAIPSPTAAPTPENLERGGILRFAIPEGAPHNDPHLTVSTALLSWGAGQAYSRLFKFETTGGNSIVVCDLCESWEQSAPLTFKIKLRDDVFWQNKAPIHGRKLTAQDVVYSLNRQATPGYPNAALLSNITEFTAVGEHEVVIRLDSPDSEVLEKLADTHTRIVAKEVVEANGDLRRGPTIGSGPWIVNEVLQDATRLLVNEDYYGDGRPYLDGIETQVMPANSVRAAGMRTKIIDVAQVELDQVEAAMERLDEIRYVGIENPSAGIEIALNTNRSPMDNPVVREAMMLTWPVGKHFVVPGTDGLVDTSNPNPGISVGMPSLKLDWLLPSHRFSHAFSQGSSGIDRANELLATAELKPTDNVIIKVGEFGQAYIDQANEMAEGLASVGIRAEVERVSTRVFGDAVWTAGNYDIMVGAPPPISSTTSYLFAVHHSAGPWNTTGYSNPEIDRLIEAQAREYDVAKRGDLLLELQQLMLDGSHRFIASTRTTHWMFWDYVHDFEPITPRGDTDFLTQVWVTAR